MRDVQGMIEELVARGYEPGRARAVAVRAVELAEARGFNPSLHPRDRIRRFRDVPGRGDDAPSSPVRFGRDGKQVRRPGDLAREQAARRAGPGSVESRPMPTAGGQRVANEYLRDAARAERAKFTPAWGRGADLPQGPQGGGLSRKQELKARQDAKKAERAARIAAQGAKMAAERKAREAEPLVFSNYREQAWDPAWVAPDPVNVVASLRAHMAERGTKVGSTLLHVDGMVGTVKVTRDELESGTDVEVAERLVAKLRSDPKMAARRARNLARPRTNARMSHVASEPVGALPPLDGKGGGFSKGEIRAAERDDRRDALVRKYDGAKATIDGKPATIRSNGDGFLVVQAGVPLGSRGEALKGRNVAARKGDSGYGAVFAPETVDAIMQRGGDFSGGAPWVGGDSARYEEWRKSQGMQPKAVESQPVGAGGEERPWGAPDREGKPVKGKPGQVWKRMADGKLRAVSKDDAAVASYHAKVAKRKKDAYDSHMAGYAKGLREAIEEDLVALMEGSSASLAKPGNRENWIEGVNGHLPPYVREVARSIHEKRGVPLSKAIEIAIGVIRNWAEGKGDVKPDTRAKAVKAIAAWEALKAKARAKR